MIKIALVGNPNSGKTTLFNHLSGKRERIGNYSGVTVSSASSKLKASYKVDQDVVLIDLPGAYGMKTYTQDEKEAIDFIQNEAIDVIINVIDCTNLERALVFTLQLLATKIPMVIALNKHDLIARSGHQIDIQHLTSALNSQVVFTEALNGKGINELLKSALSLIVKDDYSHETT
jgi:ferrous iron transport protein B